jgi:hypothetical protein
MFVEPVLGPVGSSCMNMLAGWAQAVRRVLSRPYPFPTGTPIDHPLPRRGAGTRRSLHDAEQPVVVGSTVASLGPQTDRARGMERDGIVQPVAAPPRSPSGFVPAFDDVRAVRWVDAVARRARGLGERWSERARPEDLM